MLINESDDPHSKFNGLANQDLLDFNLDLFNEDLFIASYSRDMRHTVQEQLFEMVDYQFDYFPELA